MGFPTKNGHFGVFWGKTILGNTHVYLACIYTFTYYDYYIDIVSTQNLHIISATCFPNFYFPKSSMTLLKDGE